MIDDGDKKRNPAVEGRIPVSLNVILAEGKISPAEMEEGLESASLELRAFPKKRVFLEAGGVVIAEGTIVRRRGQSFFRVRKINLKSSQEAVQ